MERHSVFLQDAARLAEVLGEAFDAVSAFFILPRQRADPDIIASQQAMLLDDGGRIV